MTEEPKSKLSFMGNYQPLLIVAMLCGTAVYAVREFKGSATAPPAPVITPTTSLASTIPDAQTRETVAAYCEAWPKMMDNVKDLGHFSEARKVGDVALQNAEQLPAGLAAFDEALAKRLEASMGNLDPSQTDLAPIKEALTKAAAELRAN